MWTNDLHDIIIRLELNAIDSNPIQTLSLSKESFIDYCLCYFSITIDVHFRTHRHYIHIRPSFPPLTHLYSEHS